MKVLVVSSMDIFGELKGGCIEGSLKTYNGLISYFGEGNVDWLTFDVTKSNRKIIRYLMSVTGHRYTLTNSFKKNVMMKLKTNEYSVVWFDYAYGGELIKQIKKELPTIKIVKFFHDINKFNIKSFNKNLPLFSIRGNNKFLQHIMTKEIEKSEKNSIKYSDSIGCLHMRDSNLIKEYYGRAADFLLPVTFAKRPLPKVKENIVYGKGINLLFVGLMNYFPNTEAIRFFSKEVMPKLPDCVFNIVGSRSLDYKDELEKTPNVKVHGRVDDLAQYYLQADAVVVPLFSGGGMKVKVCEAMSYGKTIFGTDEAFVGYDIDFDKIGGLCNSTGEFVTKINEYFATPHTSVNQYSLECFENKYTNEVAFATMANMLDGLVK